MSLEILPSAPDVIACRFQGKITHDALQRVIDLVDHALATQEKTHIYVEIVDFGGFETARLPEYLRRAMPMLGKLKSFGRIAVVSDETWLRAMARVESALLPNISYEVFDRSERDQALAWVEGRVPHPYGDGMSMVETGQADVLAFEVNGKVTKAQLDQLADRLAARLAGPEPVRVLLRIRRLAGVEFGGLVDADLMKTRFAALSRAGRYAAVGGPAWLGGWVAIMDAMARADLRHFTADDEDSAWQWLDVPRPAD